MRSTSILGLFAALASGINAQGKGKIAYGGVNLAGLDFGCSTDGDCDTSSVSAPLKGIPNAGGDGVQQMTHYTSTYGFNTYRLPVGWQYLVSSPGSDFIAANMAIFDQLMQDCLKAGATCIIDIHNYARWDGKIVNQDGPSKEQFADLWKRLAGKYKSEDNVAYGLVNEPHDVDMTKWADACQSAVNAIRGVGAKGMILLPGTQYTAAGAFMSQSVSALANVKNPDGTTTGLIFDLHNYFDSDNSGTNPVCTSNKISNAIALPVDWLRQNKRQALFTELGGGGSDGSCMTMICDALDFIAQNSDVYLGWLAWGAGAFQESYPLVLQTGPLWGDKKDVPLVEKCFGGKFKQYGGGAGITPTSSSSTTPVSNGDSAASSTPTSGIVPVASGVVSNAGDVPNDATKTAKSGVLSFLQQPGSGSGKQCRRRRLKRRATIDVAAPDLRGSGPGLRSRDYLVAKHSEF